MGMETEDEDGRPLENLGPLTRINMQRRAHPKHVTTTALPWDEHRIHFNAQITGNADDLREKLRTAKFPIGWSFCDVVVESYGGRRVKIIFDIERAAITLSEGAQIRAIINLLK